MVTFWLIEAMSRVSSMSLTAMNRDCQLNMHSFQASNSKAHISGHPELEELRKEAFTNFGNALSFSNHLGIFSEEVGMDGEQIGNMPQAFSHLLRVSAAMNFAK